MLKLPAIAGEWSLIQELSFVLFSIVQTHMWFKVVQHWAIFSMMHISYTCINGVGRRSCLQGRKWGIRVDREERLIESLGIIGLYYILCGGRTSVVEKSADDTCVWTMDDEWVFNANYLNCSGLIMYGISWGIIFASQGKLKNEREYFLLIRNKICNGFSTKYMFPHLFYFCCGCVFNWILSKDSDFLFPKSLISIQGLIYLNFATYFVVAGEFSLYNLLEVKSWSQWSQWEFSGAVIPARIYLETCWCMTLTQEAIIFLCVLYIPHMMLTYIKRFAIS